MPHQITIVGNLGRDGELRFTPGGTQVLEFSVASQDGFGENKRTAWFRCSMFGEKRTTKLSPYLTKGKAVLVFGTLKADEKGNPPQWERQDGSVGTNFDVRVDRLEFAGGKKAVASEMKQAALDLGGKEVDDEFPPKSPF